MNTLRPAVALCLAAALALGACSDDASSVADGGASDGQLLTDGARPDGVTPTPDGPTPDGVTPTPDTLSPDTVDPCGNGVVDTGEDCDGALLGGKDCNSLGFDKGTLTCKPDCSFDTSGCQHENCGNGKLDGNEDCDGALLGGKDCKSQGFDGGSLTCSANCAFDTSGCTKCGDGTINQAIEECDGKDLGGKQCQDVGSYTGGLLKCSATCQYDKTGCTSGTGKTLSNMIFLHHSVGDGILSGGVRPALKAYNTANGTTFALWSHLVYDDWDIVDPNGNSTPNPGGYVAPRSQWLSATPVDWKNIWTGTQAKYKTYRDTLLKNHEVIIFKNCFFVIDENNYDLLKSPQDLTTFKNYYLQMRNVFDTRKDRLFVVVTIPPAGPPSNPSSKTPSLARQFANWLCSSTYLAGHPNVACWDLFDLLAIPAGQPNENTIKPAYWTSSGDFHPNATANKMLATEFASFLTKTASAYKAAP